MIFGKQQWAMSNQRMAQQFFDLNCNPPPEEDDDQNQHAGQSCKTCISTDDRNKEFSRSRCKIRKVMHLSYVRHYV
jgi:hypothetical protein